MKEITTDLSNARIGRTTSNSSHGLLSKVAVGGALALAVATGTGRYFIGRQNPQNSQSIQIEGPDYVALTRFKTNPSVVNRNIQTVMYDFGREEVLTLRDLDLNGSVDQLEIESCLPYRGATLNHIYISRSLVPNAIENENFTVVDPTFFDTFNRLNGE